MGKEKTFEELTKEVLALAWSQFNQPLWEARQKMQLFLEENFEVKNE